MKRKYAVSILICLFLLILPLLTSSCNSETDNKTINQGQNTTNNNTDETVISTETATERLKANLPEIDMKGRNFTVLYCTHPFKNYVETDIFAQGENGDIINDAVYKRNRTVEAQLNCVIQEFVTPYSGAAGEITKRVRANDTGIDAAAIYLNQVGGLATTNMLIEYGNLPYIDLTKPWWDKNSVESLSISNKLFAACSDFLVYDKRAIMTIVFNKQLVTDYALEDIYSLVKNGDWTIDKMREMTKGISQDLDGNGEYDDKDRYGIIYSNDTFISFINGGGECIAEKDKNDIPYMTINSDRALDVIRNLGDLLYDESICLNAQKYFGATKEPYTDGMTRMFQEQKALFVSVFMNDVESLRGMSTDFGIIPPPKYNKEQDKYYSNVNPFVGTAIIVPQTCPSPEESSAVLEALSCEGRYTLQPAYYEVCLNTKVARDEESGDMLDIIFNNRVYDIGNIYNFGGLANTMISVVQSRNTNFVSTYEKLGDRANKDIDKIVASFEATE